MIGVEPGADWVVPSGAMTEAGVVATGLVRHAATLAQLVEALTGAAGWPELESSAPPPVEVEALHDLADVKGQPTARHALEVAAAGGHHVLFVGPPGAGKTMLARWHPACCRTRSGDCARDDDDPFRIGTKLPASGLIVRPPFRAPHHTSSEGSLVGGGSHAM